MSDDDDQPAPPDDSTSFPAELGRTFGGFVFVAIFLAIAGGILWLFLR